jgi:hypothetical protein
MCSRERKERSVSTLRATEQSRPCESNISHGEARYTAVGRVQDPKKVET